MGKVKQALLDYLDSHPEVDSENLEAIQAEDVYG